MATQLKYLGNGDAATPEPEIDGGDGLGDEPFITPADIKCTVSRNVNDYYEVACNKCGNPMFVKRR